MEKFPNDMKFETSNAYNRELFREKHKKRLATIRQYVFRKYKTYLENGFDYS